MEIPLSKESINMPEETSICQTEVLDLVYLNCIVLPSVLIAWLKIIGIHGKKGYRYEQEIAT